MINQKAEAMRLLCQQGRRLMTAGPRLPSFALRSKMPPLGFSLYGAIGTRKLGGEGSIFLTVTAVRRLAPRSGPVGVNGVRGELPDSGRDAHYWAASLSS